MDKPESSCAQVGLFARKKEDEKFQQVVNVNYKLEEIIYWLNVMNSVYDKVITNLICLLFINILSIRVKMSGNIGDNRNLLLKLKSKLGLYHVVLTTPKISHEKLTLTVVEMQQLPDIEKTDSKEAMSRLNWTIYIGSRKVYVNFQTDTDKLRFVVYRYRNSLYLKDNEVDLKMTEYQSLLAKRVDLLSYIDIFYKRCIVLDETTLHN